jgi:uncharacterized protein (DUF4415 family)
VPEKQPKRNVKRSTVRSTQRKPSRQKTDWVRVDALTDADIRRAIRSDPDAAPELDAASELDSAWFRRAKVVLPEPKKAVSIRLDRDVVEWFQRHGRGYQTRINAVLRAYVSAQPSR